MKTVGILGGSFNPVHIGHLVLANYIVQFTDVDEVWLTLSPLNPLKQERHDIASDKHRMEMLMIATATGDGAIKTCGIELSMPKPSFTIDTLRALKKQHSGYRFKLIIGSDNWLIFDRWKRHDEILKNFGVVIYPRPGYPLATAITDHNAEIVNAPEIELSSSFIRDSIAMGKNMNFFLPFGVYKYICDNNLYKN